MPFGLGWPELVIILVIVLVIFGASRVPEIGRALGKGIREFRGSVSEVVEGRRRGQARRRRLSRAGEGRVYVRQAVGLSPASRKPSG